MFMYGMMAAKSAIESSGPASTTNTISAAVSGSSSRQPGELYPPIEPYNSGWLTVSDIHEIYYEECGNKDGNPVVYLHGGPGSGSDPSVRRFYDPHAYRIIVFDQRGCGKSRPSAELKDNTTWDLVSDLEKLREHLGVSKWVVLGGCWGATLALSYALKHPGTVKALILGGIFTLRREELVWLFQEGVSFLFPDKWEKFLEPIPEVERGDMLSAYHRRVIGSDEKVQLQCAKAWSEWQLNILQLNIDPALVETKLANDGWVLAKAKLETECYVHGGWFPTDNYLLDNVDKIRHLPATIIQGRYDVTTPMKTAWELHKRWPEAEFHVVPDAGHFFMESGTIAKLTEATNKYKNL